LFELRVRLRRLVCSHAAKLFVIDQLFHRRLLATYRTLRILPQFELAKLHGPGIKQQQPIDQQIFRAENDLDRLVCLNRADDARQNAQHTAFRARWYQSRRRWLRIQTTITSSLLCPENTRLTFEPEDRAVDVWLAAQHAGIVDEITRGKVVGAIDDD